MFRLLSLCQQLQDSAFGTSLRESAYAFPITETIHVLALSLAVGTIIWFDLRLAGFAFRDTPVSTVFHQVRPWMSVGFAAMFITGGMLFAAHAADVFESVYFRMKIGLLLLAAVNILAFHLTIDRRRAEWDNTPTPPLQARIAGLCSIVLWFGVIAAGRFTAYTL